jgi:hypothetical protein
MNRESDINIVAKAILSVPTSDTDGGWFGGETWCLRCNGIGFQCSDPKKNRDIVHKENCPVAAAQRLLENKYNHA